MPIIAFPSFSKANERLRPKTPAKVKAIHNIAGAAKLRISTENPNAKLNTTIISRAKSNIEENSSLVLSSVIISFFIIAQILFISFPARINIKRVL
ncbi:MAG: hypothetical protein DHS20C13_06340 [Thermodesulfobacteriota bacterium]|nr:MAG: hypothetical protein DHS20C13_06340 [Thermodesulfobacteriota bacterium]